MPSGCLKSASRETNGWSPVPRSTRRSFTAMSPSVGVTRSVLDQGPGAAVRSHTRDRSGLGSRGSAPHQPRTGVQGGRPCPRRAALKRRGEGVRTRAACIHHGSGGGRAGSSPRWRTPRRPQENASAKGVVQPVGRPRAPASPPEARRMPGSAPTIWELTLDRVREILPS